MHGFSFVVGTSHIDVGELSLTRQNHMYVAPQHLKEQQDFLRSYFRFCWLPFASLAGQLRLKLELLSKTEAEPRHVIMLGEDRIGFELCVCADL